jgi:hypothetical protein
MLATLEKRKKQKRPPKKRKVDDDLVPDDELALELQGWLEVSLFL